MSQWDYPQQSEHQSLPAFIRALNVVMGRLSQLWRSVVTTATVGAGTTNRLPKWTAPNTLGDSSVTDTGTLVSTANPIASGTNPAQTGQFRAPNAVAAFTARNAANTGDIALIYLTSGDLVAIRGAWFVNGSSTLYPSADNLQDLGSPAERIKDLYMAGVHYIDGVAQAEIDTVNAPLTLSAGDLDFDETAALGNNARVTVRKNTGADVGTRRRLNLIEGSNVTLTVADDAGSEEVDVTIAASGGSLTATTVEVDLGSTPVFRGKFTITDAAIASTSKVKVWQAPGPYTGKGTRADEAEMQPVSVIATEPATGSAVVKWETPPAYAVGPGPSRPAPNLGGGSAVNSGTNRDDQWIPHRVGKIRGNVKFSYTIAA